MNDSVLQIPSWGGRIYPFFTGKERFPMRVDDEIRKCVVFLQYRKQRRISIRRNRFLCWYYPIPDSGGQLFGHVITARHTIEQIKIPSISVDQRVFFKIELPQFGNSFNSNNDR